eukprot:TRINITY_DN388_c0_g1_i2.p1 TRINITY_DN388_c0_g1~~TRINITY_DN388_c0_g1_i2.p1  ORF type:complete len:827 (-),score=203.38 TRINITY_DN388_c0_g1_i2:340-2475(-)
MTLLMTLGWESFGGFGIAAIASAYGVSFYYGGIHFFYENPDRAIVGVVLGAMAVSMTPLTVYGLQRGAGFWTDGDPGNFQNFRLWVKGSWIWMEVATVVVGMFVFVRIPAPFLLSPVAFCLFLMSMDLTPLLFGRFSFTMQERHLVSFWFGIAMMLTARHINARVTALVDPQLLGNSVDYSYWISRFGVWAYFFGCIGLPSSGGIGRLLFHIAQTCLLLAGALYGWVMFGFVGLLGTAGSIQKSYGRRLVGREINSTTPLPLALAFFVLSILQFAAAHKYSDAFCFSAALCNLVFLGENILSGILQGSRNVLSVFLLFVSFSFLGMAELFVHPISLYFFHLMPLHIFVLISVALLFPFHGVSVAFERTNTERVIWFALSVFTMFFRVFFEHASPVFAWLGAFGTVVAVTGLRHNQQTREVFLSQFRSISVFLLSLFLMAFALGTRDNILFLFSFGVNASYAVSRPHLSWKNIPIALVRILISPFFKSSMLAAHGGLHIFGWLSDLAYNVFKHSVIFPFALTAIGLSVIRIGLLFHDSQSAIETAAVQLLPAQIQDGWLWCVEGHLWHQLSTTVLSSAIQNPSNAPLLSTMVLPATVVWALSQQTTARFEQLLAVLVGVALTGFLFFACYQLLVAMRVITPATIARPTCTPERVRMSLARNPQNNGMLVTISGTKAAPFSLQGASVRFNLVHPDAVWQFPGFNSHIFGFVIS